MKEKLDTPPKKLPPEKDREGAGTIDFVINTLSTTVMENVLCVEEYRARKIIATKISEAQILQKNPLSSKEQGAHSQSYKPFNPEISLPLGGLRVQKPHQHCHKDDANV